jgi:DNA polymerase-4
MRHSIVMSKNSLAKTAGVITGISFKQAREICPTLNYVKADYTKYLAETKAARIVPYGMDESWIDLGEQCTLGEAAQVAELIRVEIKYAMGLSASLGVSFNYIFSKIGSDLNKPDAVSVVTPEGYKETLWPLPASALLFVGGQRKKLLKGAGIVTIGDVANAKPEYLVKLLGKAGNDLWRYANGDDRTFKPESDMIGSIGNTITPPADLRSNEEAGAILYLLAGTVCARLQKHGLKAHTVSVSTRDSKFNRATRQCSLANPTDNVNYVFNKAFALFRKHYKWEKPLRSVGIRADNLDSAGQLSLFAYDDCAPDMDVTAPMKALNARFGTLTVEKSAFEKELYKMEA